MIEIYPNRLRAEPAESYAIDSSTTIDAWMRANIPSYRPGATQPVVVTVNGEECAPEDWACHSIEPSDDVAIIIQPKGSALETIFRPGPLAKLFGLGNPFAQLKPNQPRTGQGRGRDLALATAKGNVAALNDVIPEIAGRRKRYPDYLVPEHRYFTGPKENWIEMLLCVGKGKYQIPTGKILVGDTPVISLGTDAQLAIYQPGADLSNERSALWWHSVPEVGATSTGTAGLELKATYQVPPSPSASTYTFTGNAVVIPAGAGSFPAGWSAGMIVRMVVPQAFTVVKNSGSADILRGDFRSLAPFVGMRIEVAGDEVGQFIVGEVTNNASGDPVEIKLNYLTGQPAVGFTAGTSTLAISYAGLRWRITAASAQTIIVDRLTDTGDQDESWPGFVEQTTSAATILLDASTQEGDWAGPFAACPNGELTDTLEWDVMFTNGLSVFNQKYGVLNFHSVTVEIQYRDIETAGPWTSVTRTYTDATLDQLGFTERASIGRLMRPEVRMRRIGAKSPDTNVNDVVQWFGLRSNLTAPRSYEGVTTIAVRLRGGEKLASQSERLVSVEATRVLPVRNGGRWDVETPTRDISAWIGHIARSIGYSDEDLDMAELDRLHEIWKARGEHYDQVFTDKSTVKGAFNEALQAGFAEFTVDHGLIRPVRDDIRVVADNTHSMPQPVPPGDVPRSYSNQNMTQPLVREFTAIRPDDFDGVDVKYTSSRTWQVETVKCRLPGDKGLKVEEYKLEGVTDEVQAYRIGMRRRCSQVYRRWTYRWSTELDALNSRYMSFDRVFDDIPGYAQSAILLSADQVEEGLILESSEPLRWSEGVHMVGVRKPDGTMSGPWPGKRMGDYHVLVGALDFEPDTSWEIEPPHLYFGPLQRFGYPVLITGIRPSGIESASVEATNYDQRVYQYDNSFPA